MVDSICSVRVHRHGDGAIDLRVRQETIEDIDTVHVGACATEKPVIHNRILHDGEDDLKPMCYGCERLTNGKARSR